MNAWSEEQYQLLLDLKSKLKPEENINGSVTINDKKMVGFSKEYISAEENINEIISESNIQILNEKIKKNN